MYSSQGDKVKEVKGQVCRCGLGWGVCYCNQYGGILKNVLNRMNHTVQESGLTFSEKSIHVHINYLKQTFAPLFSLTKSSILPT